MRIYHVYACCEDIKYNIGELKYLDNVAKIGCGVTILRSCEPIQLRHRSSQILLQCNDVLYQDLVIHDTKYV